MSCEKRKQWFSVLKQLQIDGTGILCAEDKGEMSVLLFEPATEQPRLLRQWLAYRGVPLTDLVDSELAQVVMIDMLHRGNAPPFARFTNFDPAIATPEFLKLWLSWYGVTSGKEQPAAWWIKRVVALQRNITQTKRSRKDTVARFAQLQRAARSQDFTGLAQSFYQLSPAAISHLNQTNQPQNQTKPAFWDIKRILAFALDASAVALPFLIKHHEEYIKSVGRGLSPNGVKALKGVGVLLGGDKSSLRWLETQTKQPFWMEVAERGTIIAAEAAQTAIQRKIKEKTADNHSVEIGKSLVTDVGALLVDKKKKVPDKVLKEIARHYLRDHPRLVLGLTDALIPAINSYYRKQDTGEKKN